MNSLQIARKWVGYLLITTGLLTLMACSGGDSSSQACSTTTTADASGNPITTVTCDNS